MSESIFDAFVYSDGASAKSCGQQINKLQELKVQSITKSDDFPDILYAYAIDNGWGGEQLHYTPDMESIALKHGKLIGVYRFEKMGCVKVTIE